MSNTTTTRTSAHSARGRESAGSAVVWVGEQPFACRVARGAAAQAMGLQDVAELSAGTGMLFPFSPPRAATFWMGRVAFPLDLVFAGADGRVARIVSGAQPGARARWSHACTSAVLEVLGGTCADRGLVVGMPMRAQPMTLRQGQAYDVLQGLVDTAGPEPGHDHAAPLNSAPGRDKVERSHVNPSDRFRDHGLPDESFSEAMDQPNSHFREQYGVQPTEGWEGIVGPSVRQSRRATSVEEWISGGGQSNGGARGTDGGVGEVGGSAAGQPGLADVGAYVAAVVEAMARRQALGSPPVAWKADVLNGGTTESAVITAADVAGWLGALELDPGLQRSAVGVVQSPAGLALLADGLVLAGLTDQARVQGHAVVLFRGRRPRAPKAAMRRAR